MRWYLAVLKNYVGFSGRARRKEFWMFTLVSVIISIVLSLVDNLIGTDTGTTRGGIGYTYNASELLSGLYGLAVLLPTLAVQFRQHQDHMAPLAPRPLPLRVTCRCLWGCRVA